MNTTTLLADVQAWYQAQSAPLATTCWRHAPPMPYPSTDPATTALYVSGAPYPFVTIQPRTMTAPRLAGGVVQQMGWVRLIYADVLGRNSQDVASLLAAATAWQDALGTAVRAAPALPTPAKPTGAVAQAGEDGEGIIAQMDEAGWTRDEQDNPLYTVPLDVYIRCLASRG